MPVQGPPEGPQPTTLTGQIAMIQKDWTDLVGSTLSKNSRPLKILRSASSSTLLIGVSSSVWANELEFLKREILEKIPDRITEIRYQIVTSSSGRI